MILVQMEHYQQAEEIFRRLIEIDPAAAGAHRSLGNVLYLQGRIQEAVDAWQRALEINPGDEKLRKNIARLKQQTEGGQVGE
jgi:small glutamine-rich tetratricopeptide repeat-containing protein alpha